MIERLVLASGLLLAACAPSAPGPRPAEVAQVAEGAPRAGWTELTVRWDYGPCDPNDARSCHQSVRVTPDGQVLQTETPNPGVSPTPKTRTSTLPPGALDALRRLLDAGFLQQMKTGFPCSRPSPDASISIAMKIDGKELTQDVTPCVREAAPSPPQQLVKSVEAYRFVR
jgi:hypothetical protein